MLRQEGLTHKNADRLEKGNDSISPLSSAIPLSSAYFHVFVFHERISIFAT
jgi:hypothetical protein